jgi:hypothetical protein
VNDEGIDEMSTDVWTKGPNQRYEERPTHMSDVCLADFWAWFTPKRRKRRYDDDLNDSDDDDNEDNDITTKENDKPLTKLSVALSSIEIQIV